MEKVGVYPLNIPCLPVALSNNIQLLDKGVGEYHFYSDETRNIRRGRRPSWI